MVLVLPVSDALALSSWSFLTEREWAPDLFGFDSSLDEGLDGAFFLGAERRWNGRFSGFVGLGVNDSGGRGYRAGRSALAGVSFNVTPGISVSLEFEGDNLDDSFTEFDDQKVTFRTVITF